MELANALENSPKNMNTRIMLASEIDRQLAFIDFSINRDRYSASGKLNGTPYNTIISFAGLIAYTANNQISAGFPISLKCKKVQ